MGERRARQKLIVLRWSRPDVFDRDRPLRRRHRPRGPAAAGRGLSAIQDIGQPTARDGLSRSNLRICRGSSAGTMVDLIRPIEFGDMLQVSALVLKQLQPVV